MTQVTIVGNLTSDPELRFTAQGKAVANFTVAVSKRVKDSDGTWKDGPSSFYRCSLWDTQAENMAESLSRGQRVIVVGDIAQRTYETNGEKRSVFEVTVTEVGPSLKWATAKPEKATTKGPGFASKHSTPGRAGDDTDPWASAPQDTDEAPF